MYTIKVSSKGQIVVPIKLRQKYGLDQGVEVGLLEFPNEIVIVPIPEDTIKAAKGMFQSKKTVRNMLEEARREEQCLEKNINKTKRAS